MRITDLAKDERVAERNLFVMDTENGTMAINGAQLAAGLLALAGSDVLMNLNMEDLQKATNVENGDSLILGTKDGNKALSINDSLWMVLDAVATPEIRRNTYRGKYLGSVFTEANMIADGSFKSLFIGDYWIIGGIRWDIYDILPDPPYLARPAIVVGNHNDVIGPEKVFDSVPPMSTTSGYLNSNIKAAIDSKMVPILESAFGTNLLEFEENYSLFTNGLSSSPSFQRQKSKADLFSLFNVYSTTPSIYNHANANVTSRYGLATPLTTLKPDINKKENRWTSDFIYWSSTIAQFMTTWNQGNAWGSSVTESNVVRTRSFIG